MHINECSFFATSPEPFSDEFIQNVANQYGSAYCFQFADGTHMIRSGSLFPATITGSMHPIKFMTKRESLPQCEVRNVKGCAACGRDHEAVMFVRLHKPTAVYCAHTILHCTHWSHCPQLGDPIYMRNIDETPEEFVAPV